jgi:hypothetical protein
VRVREVADLLAAVVVRAAAALDEAAVAAGLGAVERRLLDGTV